MNYVDIKCPDIANGPGCRVSVFVAGCSIRCPGCFNSEAWDYNSGQRVTLDVMMDIAEKAMSPGITGLTILGGEPFDPHNVAAVSRLIRHVKGACDRKNIDFSDVAVFTGYTVEKLLERFDKGESAIADVLANISVLVDGPFVESLKDISLGFRGSSNQRILDAPRSFLLRRAVPTKLKDWLVSANGT